MAVDGRRMALRLRCERPVCPVNDGFFKKQVMVRGIPVRSAACVDDAALAVAADRLSRQLGGLPASVLRRLSDLKASVHVIGRGQVTSDLPEHAHMRGVDGGYTGEAGVTLDNRTRGMGGLKSSCGEENLLCLEGDPTYGERDILTHEFSHAIMDYGLPPAAVAAIRAQHAASTGRGLWRRQDGSWAYAGSNASEYWAELSMWYWGTHGEFVQPGMPAPGPGGLHAYDPDGFALVAAIYSGAHPAFGPGPGHAAPQRAVAIARDADLAAYRSVPGDGEACELVVRNATDAAQVLRWIDSRGAPHVYATVAAGDVCVQHTFVGHVWALGSQDHPLDVLATAPATAPAASPAAAGLGLDRAPAPAPATAPPMGPSPLQVSAWTFYVAGPGTWEIALGASDCSSLAESPASSPELAAAAPAATGDGGDGNEACGSPAS